MAKLDYSFAEEISDEILDNLSDAGYGVSEILGGLVTAIKQLARVNRQDDIITVAIADLDEENDE